jgi:hypothetical protein
MPQHLFNYKVLPIPILFGPLIFFVLNFPTITQYFLGLAPENRQLYLLYHFTSQEFEYYDKNFYGFLFIIFILVSLFHAVEATRDK